MMILKVINNFILDKSKMVKNMDKVLCSHKNIGIKDSGIMIKKLEDSKKHKQVNIKVILNKIKDKEKDNSFGLMENIIQDNGKMEKNMEVDIGNQKKDKVIWVNGEMDKLQDMEYIQ